MGQIRELLNNNQGVLTAIGLVLTIGIAILGRIFFDKKKKAEREQKIEIKGNKNRSLQAGRDINIDARKEVKAPQKKKNDAHSDFKLIKGEPGQMEINGVLWEWYWRENSDRRDKVLDILDLKPFCPKHKYELKYKFDHDDILGEQWPIALFCRTCNSIVGSNDDIFHDCRSVPEFEDEIRRLILAEARQ